MDVAEGVVLITGAPVGWDLNMPAAWEAGARIVAGDRGLHRSSRSCRRRAIGVKLTSPTLRRPI